MANNTTAFPAGLAEGDPVSPAQFLQLDANARNGANLTDGSTHTPTSVIEILGEEGMMIETLREGTGFEVPPLITVAAPYPIIIPAHELFSGSSHYTEDLGSLIADGGGPYSTARGAFKCPVGTVLSSFTAYIRGPTSSTWPSTFVLQAYRVEATTGDSNEIGTAGALGGTQGQYEAGTSVSVTDIAGSSYRTLTGPTQHFAFTLRTEQVTGGERLFAVVAQVIPIRMAVP